MGISNIDRAKSEGKDWITRAGSALREATVGDGRRHSDAVPRKRPNSRRQSTAIRAIHAGGARSSRTCSKRLSGPRTASSSASNVIAVANGRFHQTGDSGVTLQG
jgi:hypothetical protein